MNDNLPTGWFLLCRSRNLKSKQILSFLLFDTPIIILRTAGKVHALLDRCPHRNIPLSRAKFKDECLECPYHGWKFTPDGNCIEIPGLEKVPDNDKFHVKRFNIRESQGFIWVCFKEVDMEEPFVIPYLNNSNYQSFIWEFEIPGTLINVSENFLDPTHTHFVHPGLVRSNRNRHKVLATINRDINSVEVCYENEKKQNGIISKWLEGSRGKSYGRFILPGICQLEYRSSDDLNLLISGFLLPINDKLQKITAVFSVKKTWVPLWLKKIIVYPFFKLALKQDIHILKMQQNNIDRFSQKEQFTFSKADLIRSHIEKLLSPEKPVEKITYQTELWL